MGDGLLVGGVILVVIGVILYVSLANLKDEGEQGIAQCQSILGQAGQFLSPEINQKCQMAQQYTPEIQAGYYIGVVMIPAGYGVAIFAVATVNPKRQGPTRLQVQGSSFSAQNNEIFCRFCGKKRPVSEEHCPFCGRDSHSSSVTMKQCVRCDAITSDDSSFCASCGYQEFRSDVKHK